MKNLKLYSIFLILPLFLLQTTFAQVCLELPEMNGNPASYTTPIGWSIWNSTPDIISGNGVYPGTSQANITNVNGNSSSGGEMVFLLINGILGANTESINTVLNGLTPGLTYYIPIEWQQVTLDYIGISADPAGGKLGVYLDGNELDVLSSTGGLTDDWQSGTISFVATSTSHVLGLKGELPDNSNRGAIVIDNLPCSILLPVELMDFNVTNAGRNVLLSWTTSSEENNDYFSIERSLNAVDWNTIGTIDGADNSSVQLHYSFLDKSPGVQAFYYRLKQVDLNGNFTYSNIRNIDFQKLMESDCFIYPNPSSGIVTVFSEGMNGFSLMDLSGKLIDIDSMIISWSESSVTLNISILSSGIYVVKSELQTQKLFKL